MPVSPMIPMMIRAVIPAMIKVVIPANPVNLENPANPARNLKMTPTRLPLRILTIIPMKAVPSDS